MELRDVVERLVALDDELRAIGNEINRALDGLRRAVLPPSRFGITVARLDGIEERLAYGSDEKSTLREIGDEVRHRISRNVHARARALLRSESEEAASTDTATALDLLRQDVEQSLTYAQETFDQIGKLSFLLSRRLDVGRMLSREQSRITNDVETQDLLEVTLRARNSAIDKSLHDSRIFLIEAENTADRSRELQALATRCRRLRDSLEDGSPTEDGRELTDLAIEQAVRLGQEREELSRRLASLDRTIERYQEISHGLFQSVTKASEILDLAGRLRMSLESGEVREGALDPLKAACIEHGIITLLLELRRLQGDRLSLDNAVAQLSLALGDLFSKIARHPELVKRLAPVWEDLTFADAGAMEADWETAYSEVLGVRKEGSGLLSVSKEDLARLAGADGLDPWLNQLVAKVDEKLGSLSILVEGLENADRLLSELAEMGDITDAALVAKRSLAHFVGEVAQAIETYYRSVRDVLTAPQAGFRRVQDQVAGFVHVEQLPADASDDDRRIASLSTLDEVVKLFQELEAQVPMELGTDWLQVERDARTETISVHQAMGGCAAQMRRLRSILFPDFPPACRDALELVERILMSSTDADQDPVADREALGEALESLSSQVQFYQRLRMPWGSEIGTVSRLALERSRRLMDLHGASLTLTFELLRQLGIAHHALSEDEQTANFNWILELVEHAHEETGQHADLLEQCLLTLDDNTERHHHFGLAFAAFHRWAVSLPDPIGDELAQRKGKQLFTEFEDVFCRLGGSVLDEAEDPEGTPLDWRRSSQLESLIELYRSIESTLADKPTKTDLCARIGGQRQRAEVLMEKIAAEADAMTGGDVGPLLFG